MRERDQESERTGEDEMRKNSSINFLFISRARVCNLGTVCIFLSQDQSENSVCECTLVMVYKSRVKMSLVVAVFFLEDKSLVLAVGWLLIQTCLSP